MKGRFKRLGLAALLTTAFLRITSTFAYDCRTDPYVIDKSSCPPELKGLQEVVLRVFTVLITLIGLVVLFLIIKAGIMIMTSGQDLEKKAKGFKQLTHAILGLLGILASYGLIVLIANWLGLVEGPFSFVKGGKIIFDFMLP